MVPHPDSRTAVRSFNTQGWCFIDDSAIPESTASKSSTYAKHGNQTTSDSLQLRCIGSFRIGHVSHRILGLSSWHNAVFLINSRLSPFTATLRGGHPFFRSYGTRLQSSLTRFHSFALVYSTHPPVSVCGTGGHGKGHNAFLGGRIKRPDLDCSASFCHFQPACFLNFHARVV